MLKKFCGWGLLLLALSLLTPAGAGASGAAPPAIPVKGMVTLVDLGADKCIPCRMMAPILEELKQEYKGKAAIVFLDVWKDRSLAPRFGIRAIPTQVFYDRQGKETFRHEGFLSKEQIELVLEKLGVAKPAAK
ncbi:MAG: thioredoxin family protein [Desulfarculaceae bacterium]|nr:thioredoxin family protein [Desulfarculaceae bacterium]MCF8074441.1 thioredoxin family protein [Desulfarculaceae bacterium]MCF8102719.1 thioredoxin family protein [Desulfarculaceae bacterium]MCF8116426.1 thioredoxin family protein [Desulfarculaceae bacterium]